jgi:hypothetical protein
MLEQGAVCGACNNKMSGIDKYLKIGHPAMMDAYQIDSTFAPSGDINPNGFIGKNRDGADKLRKQKEAKKIVSKDNSGQIKTTIEMQYTYNEKDLLSTFTDADFCNSLNFKFSVALHKCLVNMLCQELGVSKVQNSYTELLDYVRSGFSGNEKSDIFKSWPYAVCYRRPHRIINIPNPQICFFNHSILVFLHTSGFWMVGSKIEMLNREVVSMLSDEIGGIQIKYNHKLFQVKDLYSSEMYCRERELLGRSCFILVDG